MTDYRTRMFDGQIAFGSGSKVNANDIPESTSRFWLTNTAQEISGSKIFADDLNMNSHKIVNVTDPISNQDATTKKYVVDNFLQSESDTLDSVCDRGNTTNQYIQAATLRSNANIYANYDGPVTDTYIYFYNGGSSTGASIMWDYSTGGFIASHFFEAALLSSRDNIYINVDGVDGDSYLYFYEDSSALGAYLKWDDVPGEFIFSHQLSMATHKIVDVVDPVDNQDVATKKWVEDNFVAQ